jgi:hypothetical protein
MSMDNNISGGEQLPLLAFARKNSIESLVERSPRLSGGYKSPIIGGGSSPRMSLSRKDSIEFASS